MGTAAMVSPAPDLHLANAALHRVIVVPRLSTVLPVMAVSKTPVSAWRLEKVL